MKEEYTAGEVEKMCGLDFGKGSELCRKGILAAAKNPSGHWRISKDALLTFLKGKAQFADVVKRLEGRDKIRVLFISPDTSEIVSFDELLSDNRFSVTVIFEIPNESEWGDLCFDAIVVDLACGLEMAYAFARSIKSRTEADRTALINVWCTTHHSLTIKEPAFDYTFYRRSHEKEISMRTMETLQKLRDEQ